MWVPGAALPEPRPRPLTGRMAGLTEALDRLPPTASIPVVVYAHDCPGPGPDLAVWADLLVRQGYAVIAPDSRARSDGATSRCTPGDAAMLATRAAEIEYAVLQVSTLSWVRQSAVFLLAVGRGAAAAARTDGRSVTAAVLVGVVEGASRRASPTLVLDDGAASGVPSVDDERQAIDFLRRLTPR